MFSTSIDTRAETLVARALARGPIVQPQADPAAASGRFIQPDMRNVDSVLADVPDDLGYQVRLAALCLRSVEMRRGAEADPDPTPEQMQHVVDALMMAFLLLGRALGLTERDLLPAA